MTQASAGDSQTLTGESGSVIWGISAPCSWVLVHTRFCLCPPGVCVFPVLGKFCYKILLTFKVRFPGDSQSLYQIVRLGRLLWGLKLSQQLKNFFDIICGLLTQQLCSGANVNLEDLSHMPRLPGLLQPEALSPGGPLLTRASVEDPPTREFEQTLRDSEGQGSLACCSPWDCKESDMT